MTVRRLFAVLFIFLSTAIAWFILGASLLTRTNDSKLEGSRQLATLWGGHHSQAAPTVSYGRQRLVTEEVTEKDEAGNAVTREVRRTRSEEVPLALDASAIEVALEVEHRRKGLLWHDTYTVDFRGNYRVRIPAGTESSLALHFEFPSSTAIYDDFLLSVNGQQVAQVEDLSTGIRQRFEAAPGSEASIEIRYRSRGLDTWNYRFAGADVGQVRDFALAMTTNFTAVDFPAGSLSPTAKRPAGEGWQLEWRFANLVSGQDIGVDVPNKVNPGPLAARITFFAPVALLFFITVLMMLGALEKLELHPMHFFFLAAAFFSFHLLLAYLADQINIHLAFGIAALVSLGLVLSYLRLVCGFGRALRYAGSAQLVFLVLFSYAFFFEGLTGLAVTIGSVITLFVLMQLTARVDWDRAFATPQLEVAALESP